MIYADYNGSAPICKDVREYLIKRLSEGPFANPNAIHYMGSKVLMAMENARSVCAKVLGADFKQVIFNSGATEGLSQAFHSVLHKNPKKEIIISGIEHSAVVNCAKYYQQDFGCTVKIVKTQANGIIDLEDFKAQLTDDTAVVCIMAANNETGVIQPYQEVSRICNDNQVPYICDTTQFIGKTLFNFKTSGADYAVMSGHKIGAMTGTGILLAKDPTTLKPIIIGGGQERGYRGGTQNYLGYETLAVALNYFEKHLDNIEAINSKRISFEKELKKRFPDVVIIGEDSPRLASTTYVSYPGIHGQAVQIELESQDIFVTTSSACSDNEPVTSKVLKSMNVTDDIGRGVVRISIGLCSDPAMYDTILDALTKTYEKLAKIKSY
ncbi:cysteine desulfurase family protein [Bacteriovorax sp. Seq25_V]|uniref:cysteine desulfurase family protein n=1 Tax=Bacteriovorax sp. Seq25_V TaxID=1201288 RepID=UPI00038A1383|nr:cysteine desulfurase family protein [Bacteriovorax sp. Seq25_V]EQC47346.1 aminotransferase, class V [Bacteriovorax sp. Seq25_V]